MIKPWPLVQSQALGDFRVFRLRSDHKISPRTGQTHDFFVLECPDWVNVVAVTPQAELVMVEQFRHGTGTVELEIPGGVMDPTDASPLEAGLRELREETGFEGCDAELIGTVFPNPAIMDNSCHTVLVRECRCIHPTEFDHSEDIVTRLVPVSELRAKIAAGEIRHSLVVAALLHFQLHP